MRPMSRRGVGVSAGARDKCPASAPTGELAAPPSPASRAMHDGLIAVLDPNLVEDPGNVIADRFLRKPKKSCDLRVIESLGDAVRARPVRAV